MITETLSVIMELPPRNAVLGYSRHNHPARPTGRPTWLPSRRLEARWPRRNSPAHNTFASPAPWDRANLLDSVRDRGNTARPAPRRADPLDPGRRRGDRRRRIDWNRADAGQLASQQPATEARRGAAQLAASAYGNPYRQTHPDREPRRDRSEADRAAVSERDTPGAAAGACAHPGSTGHQRSSAGLLRPTAPDVHGATAAGLPAEQPVHHQPDCETVTGGRDVIGGGQLV
jgi:hypothetical protein